jgi:hypothetical protein
MMKQVEKTRTATAKEAKELAGRDGSVQGVGHNRRDRPSPGRAGS